MVLAPPAVSSIPKVPTSLIRFSQNFLKLFTINSGAFVSERECNNPKPSDPTKGCEGETVKVDLCDDSALCTDKPRQLVVDYAGEQCAKISKVVPAVDPAGVGMQAAFSSSNQFHPPHCDVTVISMKRFFIRSSLAIVRHLLQAGRR